MTVARARDGAAWVHLVIAGAIIVGVSPGCLSSARTCSGPGAGGPGRAPSGRLRIVHSLELLVALLAIVAWMPRDAIALSVGLAVVGTAQVALAQATAWTGALHPLGALIVLIGAAMLVRSDLVVAGRDQHERAGPRGAPRRRPAPALAARRRPCRSRPTTRPLASAAGHAEVQRLPPRVDEQDPAAAGEPDRDRPGVGRARVVIW